MKKLVFSLSHVLISDKINSVRESSDFGKKYFQA
jgi:hypothetical protein